MVMLFILILTCPQCLYSRSSRVMAVMDLVVGVMEEDGEAAMMIECQTLVVASVRWIGQVRN